MALPSEPPVDAPAASALVVVVTAFANLAWSLLTTRVPHTVPPRVYPMVATQQQSEDEENEEEENKRLRSRQRNNKQTETKEDKKNDTKKSKDRKKQRDPEHEKRSNRTQRLIIRNTKTRTRQKSIKMRTNQERKQDE